VRAPVGGIIVSKNAIRGQQVNPGRAATETVPSSVRRPSATVCRVTLDGDVRTAIEIEMVAILA
jgi:multidrug resistance efflux pump